MQHHIVYCSCAGRGEIAAFTLDEDSGALKPHSVTKVPGICTPAKSLPLTLSVDHRFLFGAVRAAPFRIEIFRIGEDGSLTTAGHALTADSLAYIQFSHSGQRLVGASYPGSLAVSHTFDSSGGELSPPVQTVKGIGNAHSVVFTADDRSIYVAALGDNEIRHFALVAGRVAPAAGHGRFHSHAGAGPRHLTLSSDERQLYCLNEKDASVDVWQRNKENGSLTLHSSTPMFTRGDEPASPLLAADIALHPSGKFVYATERTTNSLAIFRVDPDEGLSLLERMTTEASPRALRMLPSGRWLLVAGEVSGRVAVYAVEERPGTLCRVDVAEAGAGASWLVTTPL
jgi:6-phosphogluconolactonase